MTERQEILIRADLFRDVMKRAKHFTDGKKFPKAVAFFKGSGRNLIARAMTNRAAIDIELVGAVHTALPMYAAIVLPLITLPKGVNNEAILTIYNEDKSVVLEADGYKSAYPIMEDYARFSEFAKKIPTFFEGERGEGFYVNAKQLCEALKSFGDEKVYVIPNVGGKPLNVIEHIRKDGELYARAVVTGLKDQER